MTADEMLTECLDVWLDNEHSTNEELYYVGHGEEDYYETVLTFHLKSKSVSFEHWFEITPQVLRAFGAKFKELGWSYG